MKKWIYGIIIVILFFFVYSKTTQELFQGYNAFLDDTIVNELDITRSSFQVPDNFIKYEKSFILPQSSMDSVVTAIKENNPNYTIRSSPYYIYYTSFPGNKYAFIFLLDVQDSVNSKTETFTISINSRGVELSDINVISVKQVKYEPIKINPYHNFMTIYRITNALGIM